MTCILPGSISAGLTFKRTVNLPAYPASQGWGLHIYLRGVSAINIESTPSGTQHIFDVPASTTSAWKAGSYGYSVRAVNATSGEVYEVDGGNLNILGDIQTATDGDYRSHAQKVLDAVEAVIENRASLDQERYRINNRELYRTPMADLLRLRAQYRNEVRQEKAKACGKSLFGQTVRVSLR